jgi:hypothetical protein
MVAVHKVVNTIGICGHKSLYSQTEGVFGQ